jgi:hypothetical protein
MAATRKRPTERSASQADKKSPTVGIIVKRGALRRYDRLTSAVGELPVELTWDRRTGQRSAERAGQAERRGTPPPTWDMADFVVVEPLGSDEPTDE